mmetsp:Transcript_30220/g.82883  ORF Transcript_30220/g.82883 Transcript_30220/m.82883 type:complete len:212 (+) Transcript_30220:41-676(+)
MFAQHGTCDAPLAPFGFVPATRDGPRTHRRTFVGSTHVRRRAPRPCASSLANITTDHTKQALQRRPSTHRRHATVCRGRWGSGVRRSRFIHKTRRDFLRNEPVPVFCLESTFLQAFPTVRSYSRLRSMSVKAQTAPVRFSSSLAVSSSSKATDTAVGGSRLNLDAFTSEAEKKLCTSRKRSSYMFFTLRLLFVSPTTAWHADRTFTLTDCR